MSDIVERLRGADEWMLVGLEGDAYSDDAPFDAADIIERQREALMKARDGVAVLGDTCKHLGLQLGQDRAAQIIAAIDAALGDGT
jgi:hypothetical protein